MPKNIRKAQQGERYYIASQWQLIRRRFFAHKLATLGSVILGILYVCAFFAQFISPYEQKTRFKEFPYSPPQRVHFIDQDGFSLRPFVYRLERSYDPEMFLSTYEEDKSTRFYVKFFVRGTPYRFWGLWDTELHLFGTDEGTILLFGTDSLGRDLFSRNLYASRISLSVGLVGIAISFIVGCALGGISGYFGGTPDFVIQRVIEVLISIPKIPLWMALSASVPPEWSSIRTYFGITIILSLAGWTTLARVVRGRLLELRTADFVVAANIAGARESSIIIRHLLPSFASYLIVNLTLAIPGMIIGETALSFLGLGIRPPAVSWGTLLQDAQNVLSVTIYPWLLLPGLFVIITVFCFNFIGDGLRDAADPYHTGNK